MSYSNKCTCIVLAWKTKEEGVRAWFHTSVYSFTWFFENAA
jgi:hypothetical protein